MIRSVFVYFATRKKGEHVREYHDTAVLGAKRFFTKSERFICCKNSRARLMVFRIVDVKIHGETSRLPPALYE